MLLRGYDPWYYQTKFKTLLLGVISIIDASHVLENWNITDATVFESVHVYANFIAVFHLKNGRDIQRNVIMICYRQSYKSHIVKISNITYYKCYMAHDEPTCIVMIVVTMICCDKLLPMYTFRDNLDAARNT